MAERRKIVVLTGAGMSVESGLTTFRDAGGLWDNYPVERVATHEGWEANPNYVNDFYNMLRVKYKDVQPNEGHLLLKELEKDYDVVVVTQNVDALHEAAGSSKVIHLHGEMMKMCSSRDVDNPRYWVSLPHEGFGETGLEVPHDAKAEDGSLLRPYIVFFGEGVPNMYDAVQEAQTADIFIIIGTSLNVYPAAGLVQYVKAGTPIYLIDPKPVTAKQDVTHLMCGASEGMRLLRERLAKEYKV
ncbi:MAG: NAD-dependent protein deacylase [Prevotella sp.]|jgi:NAD-dependent deacetylase|nr:NAD-dependent protein deacylase [Prevotella sp.]MBO6235067.1 NAD-dependent protein deacylase [Prevotella sp.]MBP3750668.1 NAD-dependent protein deacylase [Prevotella sp.]MBQ2533869.1 NAD-dependent protein deacylase [Prevotella sp.]